HSTARTRLRQRPRNATQPRPSPRRPRPGPGSLALLRPLRTQQPRSSSALRGLRLTKQSLSAGRTNGAARPQNLKPGTSASGPASSDADELDQLRRGGFPCRVRPRLRRHRAHPRPPGLLLLRRRPLRRRRPQARPRRPRQAALPKVRRGPWGAAVRAYRRNALRDEQAAKLVKVAVDGAPYLRKVDLAAHDGYAALLRALHGMFASCLGADGPGASSTPPPAPSTMFVDSCKRIRLMKSSEAGSLYRTAMGRLRRCRF
ncbi:hypothetical protein BDA96_09G099700, partial [Sorghum bicolor]